jgi:hypothetical protein
MEASTRGRHAALLIHALPQPMRQQVLSRLNSDERGTVEPLLAELAQLGISPAGGEDAPAGAMTPAHESAAAKVVRLDGPVVAHCIAACQPATIVQLLKLGEWPWRAAMLAAMPADLRYRVLRLERKGGSPPSRGVARSICLQLLGQAGQPAGAARARSIRSRIKGWLAWRP